MSKNRVVLAEDKDFPELFALVSESFANRHPFIESFYPNHQTPEGRAAGAKRLLSFAKADPNTYFVKVVDEHNKILGFTKWNIWIDQPPSLPEEHLPWAAGVWDPKPWEGLDAEHGELAKWTLRYYLNLRLDARKASGGRLVSLDLMCVSPDHQRGGVGSLLMEWGCAEADKYNVEAVVEASDEGKGLYEKFKFQALRHVELREPSGRWQGQEAQPFYWMVRPVHGKGSVSPELTAASKETANGCVVDSGRNSELLQVNGSK